MLFAAEARVRNSKLPNEPGLSTSSRKNVSHLGQLVNKKSICLCRPGYHSVSKTTCYGLLGLAWSFLIFLSLILRPNRNRYFKSANLMQATPFPPICYNFPVVLCFKNSEVCDLFISFHIKLQ